MSTETELQDAISQELLKQKDAIVKGLVAGAIESVGRDLKWRAGEAAGKIVDEFIKTDVLPELQKELAARKVETVTALVSGVQLALKEAGNRLQEAAAKNLAQSWNLSKLSEALFK